MNDREFADALVWIANSPIIAVDTETTGLHPHEYDRAMGISVANEYNAVYFPLRYGRDIDLSYDQARNLIELLSERRHRILFHNAIFDWPVLRNEGWNYPVPWRDTWDTMVCSWILDENESKQLENQVEFHISYTRAKEQKKRKQGLERRAKKVGWGGLTFDEIREYGTMDARNTFDLYLWQREQISKHSDLAISLVREHRFLQVCDEMISNGVRVDFEQAQRKLTECDVAIEKLEIEYPGLNFDSPKQIAQVMFTDEGLDEIPGWGIVPKNFTSTGQASTDKDTLLSFVEYEPRINDIFDYRKLRKARSTYYAPLCERQGRDGRVHPWFRPHGTKTGRMSCSDPNAQTLPSENTLPGIRECFVPDEGYTLMEFDLEQAELRVASYYADDVTLSEHLATGDIHTATAMAMFGRTDGDYRRAGKTLNFAALYGIGAAKFSRTAKRSGLNIHEDTARQYLGQWRNLYHGVTRAMRDAEKIAIERGYVKLWPEGRYRRFASGHCFDLPKDALNAIVQGGVGEYVKRLMMDLREAAISEGCRLVLNVHDSLVYEVPIGREKVWTRNVRQVAARENPFIGMDMPIGAKVWNRSD